MHERFTLVEGYRDPDGKWQRPVVYEADFVYQRDGRTVVEDVKGMRLPAYLIKKKLMWQVHGIQVIEIGGTASRRRKDTRG